MKKSLMGLLFFILLTVLVFSACGGETKTTSATTTAQVLPQSTASTTVPETSTAMPTVTSAPTATTMPAVTSAPVTTTPGATPEVTTSAPTTTVVTTTPQTTALTTAPSTTTEANMNTLLPDTPHASSFSVSKAFSSDMVLQRGEAIRVWGWADASENGKKVSADFMGITSEAVIENGEWMITFKKTFEASSALGNSMKIYGDGTEVVFEDVLIGDVFMVIGQSNVAYSITQHLIDYTEGVGGDRELIVSKKDSLIRLNYNTLNDTAGYPARGTTDVCADVVHKRGWQLPTFANLRPFSALAFFTAYHLDEALKGELPIGLIEIDGNGLSLGAFMPNHLAEELKTDKLNAADGKYYTTGYNNHMGARFMYNHYMHPFANYALAGIIWYQGESDAYDSDAYVFTDHFAGLMTYLRSTHNITNPDFPVFAVEFPSIYPAIIDFGKVRGMVGSIPQVLDNSYIAVSSDLWNNPSFHDNLHPNCKFPQGERLAKLILSVICDKMPLEQATGPILESFTLAEDKKSAILTFTNVGEGLKTSDGSQFVKGMVGVISRMALSTAPITAEIISPNTIQVTCSSRITGVAYNVVAGNYYGVDINLCNSEGNPASAFWAK